MTISASRYVLITSAVAAGAGVAARELIGRIFSDNPLTPAGAILEFTSAADVGSYYGTTSDEYKRAVFYFGWVSKIATRAKKISFGRWASAAAPARIYGARFAGTLAGLNAITTGTLNITVGGQTANVTAIDLSGAGSLTAVAAALQTAIRAAAGSQFTTALVAWDAVNQRFNFTASTNGAAAISMTGSALSDLLGWTPANLAIYSPGVDVQTIPDALTASAEISTNFGSFAFTATLTTDQLVAAAQWNDALNIEYMFCARVPAADAAVISAAIIGLSGSGMTLANDAAEFPELVPMIILAATDYTRRNSVQNYMFQQFALTPTVSSNANADIYDDLRVNYYGLTQTAGTPLAFYQRGVLTGGAGDALDMNVYANEIWLKDACRVAMLQLLLALPRLPANANGRAQVLAKLQEPINAALRNGTISVDKTLTVDQIAFITGVTGQDDAWHQVQATGYWVDVTIEPFVGPGGLTEYRAVYTLIYAKDDAVRKVEGSNLLI